MSDYKFRPAVRSEAKPLIGLYAVSGTGKTYSSLILARGFVGPQGRIGMIETESGRGESYADPGEYPELAGPNGVNYLVLPLRTSFSPMEYGKALDAAEQAKLDALIIDSASHEWEGAGGVLSMAAENQKKDKKGPLVWQQPKLMHQRHFMLRFMQTPIPLVILCMRAKYPMREIEDPRNPNKKIWIRSEDLTPKQSEDILFEMFIHGWIGHDHHFHRTRCTVRDLEQVFVDDRPISLETGQGLAEWCKNRGQLVINTATETANPLEDGRAAARRGKEAFMYWWNGPGRRHRETVRSHMPEFQATAAAADAGTLDDEDPFGLPAGDQEKSETQAPAQPNGAGGGHAGAADEPSTETSTETPQADGGIPKYVFIEADKSLTPLPHAGAFSDRMESEIKEAQTLSQLGSVWKAQETCLMFLQQDTDQTMQWHTDLVALYDGRIKELTPKTEDVDQTQMNV